jgi:hypothetical protein
LRAIQETQVHIRKWKCKSGNFRAIQETEVQIWKLEGNSGNGSANLETGGQSFNNISVISWRSVLLVEEIGVPRENH